MSLSYRAHEAVVALAESISTSHYSFQESDVFFLSAVCSLSEFLAKSDEYVYKLGDNLLDAMTNGAHSKSLKETEPVSTYCDILTDSS